MWLDASCICVDRLERVFDLTSSQLQGWFMPHGDFLLEMWAFAAPSNHPVLKLWKHEMESMASVGVYKYCKSVPNTPYLDINSTYLAAYVCQMVVRLNNPHLETTVRGKCSTTEGAPFFMYNKLGFIEDSFPKDYCLRSVKYLMRCTQNELQNVPLIKLTGGMRFSAERNLRGYLANILDVPVRKKSPKPQYKTNICTRSLKQQGSKAP